MRRETEGCPSLDEGRCGIPVIPVTSSKQRRNIERGILGAIFFEYLSRIDAGIRLTGGIGRNCSKESKKRLPGI